MIKKIPSGDIYFCSFKFPYELHIYIYMLIEFLEIENILRRVPAHEWPILTLVYLWYTNSE